MDAPTEIRKCEVGSLSGLKAAALDLGRLCEEPDSALVVVHDGLADVTRERGQIESIPTEPRAVSRERHARLALAGPLRLELPAAGALQVCDRDPQVVSVSGRICDLRNLVVI